MSDSNAMASSEQVARHFGLAEETVRQFLADRPPVETHRAGAVLFVRARDQPIMRKSLVVAGLLKEPSS